MKLKERERLGAAGKPRMSDNGVVRSIAKRKTRRDRSDRHASLALLR
jgi:hypothetical protein